MTTSASKAKESAEATAPTTARVPLRPKKKPKNLDGRHRDLFEAVGSALEEEVFVWNTFPLTLPPSAFLSTSPHPVVVRNTPTTTTGNKEHTKPGGPAKRKARKGGSDDESSSSSSDDGAGDEDVDETASLLSPGSGRMKKAQTPTYNSTSTSASSSSIAADGTAACKDTDDTAARNLVLAAAKTDPEPVMTSAIATEADSSAANVTATATATATTTTTTTTTTSTTTKSSESGAGIVKVDEIEPEPLIPVSSDHDKKSSKHRAEGSSENPVLESAAESKPESIISHMSFGSVFAAGEELVHKPEQDDLLSIATAGGKRKKLSLEQRRQIRKRGEFSVQSVNFEGQEHVWHLSSVLQTGTERIWDSFVGYAAVALSQFIISFPNRFIGRYVSVKQGFLHLFWGIKWLLDIFIGVRTMKKVFSKFSHGSIISSYRKRWVLKEYLPLPKKGEPLVLHHDSEQLDLRLYDLMHIKHTGSNQKSEENVAAFWKMLEDILKRTEDQWCTEQHEFYKHLQQTDPMSLASLTPDLLADKYAVEFNRRLLSNIVEASDVIHSHFPNIVPILLSHFQCALKIYTQSAIFEEQREAFRAETLSKMIAAHSIKSRITDWRNDQINKAMNRYDKEHMDDDFNTILDQLRHDSVKCPLQIWLMEREAQFYKEIQPKLELQLRTLRKARSKATFRSKIWCPRNWKIKEGQNGYFTCETWRTSKVRTTYPGWRLVCFWRRICCWIANTYYGFLVVNLWRGPLGIQAQFRTSEFPSHFQFNSHTGKVEVSDRGSTYVTRIASIWNHVATSRHRFESAPDYGLLGKNVSRFFNVIINYVFKGFLGTLILVPFQPILTLMNILFSLLLVITALVYVPFAVLTVYFFEMFIYDFLSPLDTQAVPIFRFFWAILVTGLGQLLLAFFMAFLVHPPLSILIMMWAVLCLKMHSLYDFIMFHTVIGCVARVPAADTFIARRIAGPGLSSTLFFQISPQNALLALHLTMELEELTMFKKFWTDRIREPTRVLEQFMNSVIVPYGLSMNQQHPPWRQVAENVNHHTEALEKLVKARITALPVIGRDLDKIKLSKADLQQTIAISARFLSEFVPAHLYVFFTSPELYWKSLNIPVNDWEALAKHYLKRTFTSDDFLVPLEDNDISLQLKVKHTGISDYMSMLEKGEWHENLDNVVVTSKKTATKTTRKELQLSKYELCQPYQGHFPSNRVLRSIFPFDNPSTIPFMVTTKLDAHPAFSAVLT